MTEHARGYCSSVLGLVLPGVVRVGEVEIVLGRERDWVKGSLLGENTGGRRD